MNKAEFVQAVAEKIGGTKADAAKAVDAVLEVIGGTLASGDEVKLPGFGVFQVAERAASEGRNPRTGEKIAIPAAKLPKFKPGAELKRLVGGETAES